MTSVRENPAVRANASLDGPVAGISVTAAPVLTAAPVVRRVGVRAAALRRSRAAYQEREARRRVREVETEAVLADYYQAALAAEEVMVTAQARAVARAEQILVEAAKVAAGSQAAAVAALRRLRELGETRAGIRELTGLSAAEVRASLTPASDIEGVADPRGGQDSEHESDAMGTGGQQAEPVTDPVAAESSSSSNGRSASGPSTARRARVVRADAPPGRGTVPTGASAEEESRPPSPEPPPEAAVGASLF